MGIFKKEANIEEVIEAIQNTGQISHDLRSKLNTIVGFSELLYDEKDGSLSSEQRDAVVRILKSSQSLVDGLSETLSLTRVGTALAREIAIAEERVKQNQFMLRAVWAAVALLIGWNLASHQFAVEAAREAAMGKVAMVEFKINSVGSDLEDKTSILERHINSDRHRGPGDTGNDK